MITQQLDCLGDEFASVFFAGRPIPLPQPGQHLLFGLFAQVVVPRSGNTDLWRNDLFTRTGEPAQGNNTFGADRYDNFLIKLFTSTTCAW